MRLLVVLLTIMVSGCADKVDVRVPVERPGWEVTGIVFSEETGAPIGNVVLQVKRFQAPPQNKCFLFLFCLGSDVEVARIKTDANGEFYYASTVPGKYTFASWCENQGLPLFAPVGELRGKRELRLPYKEENCAPVANNSLQGRRP